MYSFIDDENEELSRKNYIQIVNNCFKYCRYFSLEFLGDTPRYKELEDYIISYKIPKEDKFNTYENSKIAILLYECNDETYKILTSAEHTLFTWVSCWGYKKPENLTFYRNDGSVFMRSIAHEAYCWTFEKDNEDISEILKTGKWIMDSGELYYSFV